MPVMFKVVVKDSSTGEIIKEFTPQRGIRSAERIEDGVLINLNHDKYHTEIIPTERPTDEA